MKLVLFLVAIFTVFTFAFFYRNHKQLSNKKLPVKANKAKATLSKTIAAKSSLANSKLGKTSGQKDAAKSANNQFRCVIIVPGLFSCKAAQAMRNKPVLMNEAPVLPLSSCGAGKCHCKYTRHDDRRMNSRREAANVARQITGNIDNKRARKGRRQSDIEA